MPTLLSWLRGRPVLATIAVVLVVTLSGSWLIVYDILTGGISTYYRADLQSPIRWTNVRAHAIMSYVMLLVSTCVVASTLRDVPTGQDGDFVTTQSNRLTP